MSLHLLDLPVEILRQILRPLLTAPESITLCPCRRHASSRRDDSKNGDDDDDDDEPPPPSFFTYPVLPLLLIHPRLHAVACPLLFEANRFVLDLTGTHHMHVRRWLKHRDAATRITPVERRQEEDGLSSLSTRLPPTLLGTTDALRRIPNLAIRLDRLRSWIQDAVVPAVSDMTLRGSLRSLEIRLAVARTPPRTDALLRPPLSGLVGLLSDPYLDSARLRVRGGGGGGWDPWRVDEEEEGEGEGEGDVVDWRALVRAVDPEGSRFPDVAAGGVQRGRYYI